MGIVKKFFIFSFLGFILEYILFFKQATSYFYISYFDYKFYIPLKPIYGLGILFLDFIYLNFYNNNIFLLSFLATFIITLYECIAGKIIVCLTKKKLWDYGNNSYQCNGFISLWSSSGWFILIFIYFFILAKFY